jgi:hypothetical protein
MANCSIVCGDGEEAEFNMDGTIELTGAIPSLLTATCFRPVMEEQLRQFSG